MKSTLRPSRTDKLAVHLGFFLLAVVAGAVSAQPSGPAAVPKASPADPAFNSFTDADQRLLENVQYACFEFFWKEVGQPSCLAKDRHKGPTSSIAAVGFQLSSLPIGVEHGWIKRHQGVKRAETILATLLGRQDNKKFGVYLHFLDLNTGGLGREGYEVVASTVDHALLMAGVMTAGEYFGGQVAELGNRLVNSTNWRAFAVGPNGYLSMGWKPDDAEHLDGSGEFLKWHWSNSSDEERLIYFLASGSPTPAYAIDPEMYFRLRRTMKHHDGGQPFAVAWSGPLFNYFFSHCWIDFRALGPDHPSRFGVNAPSIDWFENSRRAVLTHRQRCIEAAGRFGTLSANRWGLSACVGRDGYIVPGTRPNLSDQDEWGEGTVAPYAAASSIMFTPKESLAAIRAFMDLKDAAGKPLIWRDPEEGGFGFADAFNLDQGYVSDDYVGIDQGPMLLAIENARTGLIWKLFMEHHVAQRAVKRLKLKR